MMAIGRKQFSEELMEITNQCRLAIASRVSSNKSWNSVNG